MTLPAVGSRVRIERDETLYPSKGTWPYYRGKTGTVVEHNLGEIGVCFGKVTPRKSRPGSFDWDSANVHWMQPWEVSAVSRTGAESPVYPQSSPSEGGSAPHPLTAVETALASRETDDAHRQANAYLTGVPA